MSKYPLHEYKEIQTLLKRAGKLARVETLTHIQVKKKSYPVQAIIMGTEDPKAPAFALFGGVHGVERIGAEVIIAFMRSLIQNLSWSRGLQEMLQHVHLVFMPMVNPGGIKLKTRGNPNGVDLMRNAPIDSDIRVPFLAGGHRISASLPWYRGNEEEMEPEAKALCEVVNKHLIGRPFSIALDCHSGYGSKDYLWYPYAGSKKPPQHLAEIMKLKRLFNRSYPHHTFYRIEPQCIHYTTHGDLWDYLYKQSLKNGDGMFLPLTLEMGSWRWVKKNPWQIFKFHEVFNPVLPHRIQRTLRRHLVLIDFLLQATHSYQNWQPKGKKRSKLEQKAHNKWYQSPHNDIGISVDSSADSSTDSSTKKIDK